MQTEETIERVVLYFDGGSLGNPGPGYGSFRFEFPNGAVEQQRIEFDQELTNNQAEYRTLITALETLLERLEQQGARPETTAVHVHTDSELIVNQLRGTYKVRNPILRTLHERARQLLGRFATWDIQWQPREVIYSHFGH
ncbi:ribonuclease HI family protein [Thermomicrobium sp. 4228-Ro]|uniref:ribonuclease HI family protein n=1 Tax=Thermomicrobium sp. 4228-Ro TaxID=2993937 RepID=UPI00224979DD|nr:ribonuclease HI family protein [Thermomicrobium sp. 4228-Ro]MCX2727661.1 ribonuclease HI family protein [Thermomicrobium sp. 4228-Ro]